MTAFRDSFTNGLDRSVWLPHYLPHWSSREASAAAWSAADGVLELSIPHDHPLWCPDTHATPLRVSGVQSGVFSGPVGSTIGQQPFVDGLQVREEQAFWAGWAPFRSRVEVRARMDLSPRSMASVWMVGLEDEPQRCGEICVFEVFGDSLDATGAAVGQGIHPFRDPALVDDFEAPRRTIDVSDWHVYAVDWREDRVDFLIDGDLVRTIGQSPDYPMQVIMAVFDFPDHPHAREVTHVPRLEVDEVVGRA